MKKLLLFLSFGMLMLFSCKKAGPEPELATTLVSFNLTDFSQTGITLSSTPPSVSQAGDTLKNYVNFLYYRVYNAAGELVRQRSQSASDPSFGYLRDTLAPGAYTVVFMASAKALGLSGSGLGSDGFFVSDESYWEDTFTKKLSLQVGSSPISQLVRLDRIVAGLQLNIQEDLPSNIVTIRIKTESENRFFKVSSASSNTPVTRSRDWIIYANQPKPKFLLLHILNTSIPHNVTISAYDRAGMLAIERTINNVHFYPNRKTVFSGDLSVNVDFTINVNPVWADPIEPVRF